MNTKEKIFLGSFIGTLFFTLISSSYLYITFKKVCKKIRVSFEEWDDLKSF
jgi:hypothetical protein